MKRFLSLFLVLIIIFGCCACKGKEKGTPIESKELPKAVFSEQFVFALDTNDWYSALTLKNDGSFRGKYYTERKQNTGADFPNGTVYYCDYYGYFTDFKQLNEYSYSLKLDKAKTQEPVGTETVENGIKRTVTFPYGIESGEKFLLYTPNTPVNEISKKALVWWPEIKEHRTSPKTVLGCYALVNTKTDEAFFIREDK